MSKSMTIMAMKTFKTECFWSNLDRFEAIIEAGLVKFAKKCDNNKKVVFKNQGIH